MTASGSNCKAGVTEAMRCTAVSNCPPSCPSFRCPLLHECKCLDECMTYIRSLRYALPDRHPGRSSGCYSKATDPLLLQAGGRCVLAPRPSSPCAAHTSISVSVTIPPGNLVSLDCTSAIRASVSPSECEVSSPAISLSLPSQPRP